MDLPRRLWWLLVAFTGSVLAYFTSFPEHFRAVGVNHYGVWFLDTYAILASNDALARGGIDIYGYNPLDYFGRPHVYPHWWLLLGKLGLTRGDVAWLGFVLGAAFFVAAIAWLRPRQPGELAWNLVVLCSPPVLLALNRGNNDLVIFVLLAPVVPCLLARRAAVRALAIGLIAVAAALKTYPAVAAVVLLAGGSPREVRGRVAAMIAVFALMAVDVARDFAHYGAVVPRPDGLMTFGAANIFIAAGASDPLANGLALATGLVAGMVFWRADFLGAWKIEPEGEREWLGFVLGAALLTGCFFAGMSFAYRWVFAVWMLPLLWRLRGDAGAPRNARRLATVTSVLLTLVLWIDPIASAVLFRHAKALGGESVTRWAGRVFLAEQPVTWALFACLLVFLVRFGRDGWRTLAGRASRV